MRVVRLVAALSLVVGVALNAGRAMAAESSNNRLNDFFSLSDTKCDDSNEPNTSSNAVIDIGGENNDSFGAFGEVNGVGTAGDIIRIEYNTLLPNKASADDKNGKVSQKEFSELCVFIDQLGVSGGRDEDTCIQVEKCKVDGSVKLDTKTDECSGDASASCKGTDLYNFLTSDQVTSIQAAFPKGNKCGVKIDANEPGKNSSIKIDLKAKKNTNSCFIGLP